MALLAMEWGTSACHMQTKELVSEHSRNIHQGWERLEWHSYGMYIEDRDEAIWMVSSASNPAPRPHDCSTLMISGNSVDSS
jgi:hypothetical protein